MWRRGVMGVTMRAAPEEALPAGWNEPVFAAHRPSAAALASPTLSGHTAPAGALAAVIHTRGTSPTPG